jgi:hypothetical protein
VSRKAQAAPATKSAEPSAADFQAAAEFEAGIAEEATKLREGKDSLTPELFMQLYPLLTRPIPSAYIQTIGSTTGKPYESTGIRSVQVQIDRMNNVLTPLWWHDEVEYSEDGKLAKVTVIIADNQQAQPLVVRSSRGGVGQGSGLGNIFKGSYTNAAKLAFARLGPGHEVYLGAADLDPDVNQEVAEQTPAGNGKAKSAESEARCGIDIARNIVSRAEEVPSASKNLRLSVSHVLGRDIGDLDDPALAAVALGKELTFEQAERVSRWIEGKHREEELTVSPEEATSDE